MKTLRKRIVWVSSIVVLLGTGCEQSTPAVPVARISKVSLDGTHSKGYWPRWGGPQGDLISRETGWMAQWPQAGPGLAWRADVGTGFSSVSVSQDRLYTMGRQQQSDVVYCLATQDGIEIWKYSYDCALVDNLHEGGPGSTPTIDGDHLYTLSREGHLFCFHRQTGEVLWSKQLEDELGVRHPQWGFTCSPLILDDKLILDVGLTVAFDKMDGKKLWQTGKYSPGYGSPAVLEHGGVRFVAVLNNDGLIVVKVNSGAVVAVHPWETDYQTSSTTPIVVGDTLFISTGYGTGCALLRFDGSRLAELYTNRQIRNHMNNCVHWEGFLYGIDGQSSNSSGCRLVCMNHRTGDVAWTKRGFGCGSLMISDGKLIVLSDEGVLAIIEAIPDEYREISRAQVLDARCWTVPVLAGHRIYCRDANGVLVCVDVASSNAGT